MYQMRPEIDKIIKMMHEDVKIAVDKDEALFMLMKAPVEKNRESLHLYVFFCACVYLQCIHPDVGPEKLVEDIKLERARQIEIHGQNNKENTGFDWPLILYEEIGELVKAVNDENETEMYKELIQVMAVCIQIEEIGCENVETQNVASLQGEEE